MPHVKDIQTYPSSTASARISRSGTVEPRCWSVQVMSRKSLTKPPPPRRVLGPRAAPLMEVATEVAAVVRVILGVFFRPLYYIHSRGLVKPSTNFFIRVTVNPRAPGSLYPHRSVASRRPPPLYPSLMRARNCSCEGCCAPKTTRRENPGPD